MAKTFLLTDEGDDRTRLRVVEVHISDLTKRETWRQASVIAEVCAHRIMGKGIGGYIEALEWLAAGNVRP